MTFSHNSHSFGFSEEDLKFIGDVLQDCFEDMTIAEKLRTKTILDMIDLMLSFQPITKEVKKMSKARKIVDITPPDWAIVDLSRLCKICRKFHEKNEPCR